MLFAILTGRRRTTKDHIKTKYRIAAPPAGLPRLINYCRKQNSSSHVIYFVSKLHLNKEWIIWSWTESPWLCPVIFKCSKHTGLMQSTLMWSNGLEFTDWPGGGAGWMLMGAGLTTGITVVWRGWMIMVFVCREGAVCAKGTAVITGLGCMETFELSWMGLFTGWDGLAGVCVCASGERGRWRKIREFIANAQRAENDSF